MPDWRSSATLIVEIDGGTLGSLSGASHITQSPALFKYSFYNIWLLLLSLLGVFFSFYFILLVGAPCIPMAIWVILRMNLETEDCWNTVGTKAITWTEDVPIILVLLVRNNIWALLLDHASSYFITLKFKQDNFVLYCIVMWLNYYVRFLKSKQMILHIGIIYL